MKQTAFQCTLFSLDQSISIRAVLKHYRLAVLALSMVIATIACDGPYFSYIDAGVEAICQVDDDLAVYVITGTGFSANSGTVISKMYTSKDGGLNWEFDREIETHETPRFNQQQGCSPNNLTAIDSTRPEIRYRWVPAKQIDRSTDGGETWTLDCDLYQLRQDVRRHTHPSGEDGFFNYIDSSPGPHGGLVDSKTGNVVLAMGWDGVLTRTQDGKWHWVKISHYGLADLSIPSNIRAALFSELWLAAALIILVLVIARAYVWKSFLWKTLAIIGLIGWLYLKTFGTREYHANPSLLSNDVYFVSGFLALGLLLISLPLTVIALWNFARTFPRILLKILIVGVITAGLFLLPFAFWSQGTIPKYSTAELFSLILTGCTVYASYRYLQPHLLAIQGTVEIKGNDTRNTIAQENSD
jgi:hypothetical protein